MYIYSSLVQHLKIYEKPILNIANKNILNLHIIDQVFFFTSSWFEFFVFFKKRELKLNREEFEYNKKFIK